MVQNAAQSPGSKLCPSETPFSCWHTWSSGVIVGTVRYHPPPLPGTFHPLPNLAYHPPCPCPSPRPCSLRVVLPETF